MRLGINFEKIKAKQCSYRKHGMKHRVFFSIDFDIFKEKNIFVTVDGRRGLRDEHR